MSYTLPLGTTARLVFKNAHNESQALAQLRSAFPQMMRGLVKAKEWTAYEDPETGHLMYNRDESRDVYHESEIELQEG